MLAAEEVEDAKAQLPDSVFRELYLAEPADDEGCPVQRGRSTGLHRLWDLAETWGPVEELLR